MAVSDAVPDVVRMLARHETADGMVDARCCVCGGNVLASQGELACMMCGRALAIARWARRPNGTLRVTGVCIPEPVEAKAPTSVGHMANRRVTRTLARDAGTSRAASVLRAVPRFPTLITASKLARTLSLSKGEVEQTLAELVEARMVRKAVYDPTYFYVGFYRP